jgi:hypothetical protein
MQILQVRDREYNRLVEKLIDDYANHFVQAGGHFILYYLQNDLQRKPITRYLMYNEMLKFAKLDNSWKVKKLNSTFLAMYMEILAQFDTIRLGQVPVLNKDKGEWEVQLNKQGQLQQVFEPVDFKLNGVQIEELFDLFFEEFLSRNDIPFYDLRRVAKACSYRESVH